MLQCAHRMLLSKQSVDHENNSLGVRLQSNNKIHVDETPYSTPDFTYM